MRLVAVIPAEPALVLLMHVPHHTGRLQWAGKKAVSRQSYGVDYRLKQLNHQRHVTLPYQPAGTTQSAAVISRTGSFGLQSSPLTE